MGARRVIVQGAARVARVVLRRRRPRPGPYSRLALTVTQRGTVLDLALDLGPSLTVTGITARDAEKRHLPLISFPATRHVRTAVDLAELIASLPDGEVEATLEMVTQSDQLRAPKYADPDRDAALPAGQIRYWAPLGRFRQTRCHELAPATLPDGRILTLRVSAVGHLVINLGSRPPAADAQVTATSLRLAGGVLTVAGTVDSGVGPVSAGRLILLGRGAPIEVTGPAELTATPAENLTRYGRSQYAFTGSIDFHDLLRTGVALDPHSIADLWMEVTPATGGETRLRRVGQVPAEQRMLVETDTVVDAETALEVLPYFTAKARNVSVALEQYSRDAYRVLHLLTDRSKKPASGDKPVWIVGERPHTAQDNGYRLFRYLRTERRDIDAYYVITADSPDRANLADLDHVLTFGSTQHMELTGRADRIVGTHHPYYLYPSRSRKLIKSVTAPTVFLQHGVMAMKWTAHTYGKFGTDFRTDMFCVSSEREKELIVGDFGYDRSEVAVTGLARFDALFADDVPVVDKQVLIAPTWRDWLTTDEILAESDYLRRWQELITHPRLRELQRSGVTVKLYLHSLMQRYAAFFEGSGVEFIKQGEVDLQHLIKQSAVMITDYSSPAFDFSFLGKPVLFFQFDRDQFYGKSGAHIDVDAELPGFAAADAPRILDRLAEVLADGFELEEMYRQRSAKFLAHRDRNNSARITEAIEHLAPRKSLATRFRQARGVHLAGQRIRKSRGYFRLMRLVFAATKLLPMDKRTIVFEADTGKAFADSPRAIYEELLRRGDSRRHVWIYDHTPPTVDPARIVIKRYSPRYFTTLARAKYWVSNQNLPFYITRRRRGIYLQTWHGTPLKRMQHDLAQIVGRDDGYLDRVSKAAAQWTHLVSPSPYASEAFTSAFRFTGELVEAGYPRNDVLAGPDAGRIRAEVRARLGIDDDTRVVLYAPTFRDDRKSGDKFIFDLPIDLDRFAAEFGDSAVLLLRTHRLVASDITIPEAATGCVRDMSSYGDIAELYLAADVLIADYSSVIFDYAITGRPILFYPYDLATYRDDVRGFYLDYEAEMPGPIALTEDELFAHLHSSADQTTAAELSQRVSRFVTRFAPYDDGNAAARVVDAVLKDL